MINDNPIKTGQCTINNRRNTYDSISYFGCTFRSKLTNKLFSFIQYPMGRGGGVGYTGCAAAHPIFCSLPYQKPTFNKKRFNDYAVGTPNV